MTLLLVLLGVFIAIGIGMCYGYSQRVELVVDERTEALQSARDEALKEAQEAKDREALAEILLNKATKKK